MSGIGRRIGFCFLLALPLWSNCGPQLENPERLQAVDGVLYLQVRRFSASLLGLVGSGGATGALYRSLDGGRSWRLISGQEWSDLVFPNPRHAYLARNNILYEAVDGEFSNPKPVHEFKDPIRSISTVGGRLMVLTHSSVFSSPDSGATWEEVGHPDFGPKIGPRAIAGDASHLAVATALGRVWIRGPDQAWRQSIVGPVSHLVFHDGAFFALTSMATLAVLEEGSVRHIVLDAGFSGGYADSGFLRLDDRLFFAFGATLYEVVNREAAPRSTLDLTSTGNAGPLAMLDEGQAVRASLGPDGHIRFVALNLREARSEELGGLVEEGLAPGPRR